MRFQLKRIGGLVLILLVAMFVVQCEEKGDFNPVGPSTRQVLFHDLVATPNQIPINGASSVITGLLADQNLEPYPGETVRFRANLGTLVLADTTDLDGRFTAVYSSGSEAGLDSVMITALDKSDWVLITLVGVTADMSLALGRSSIIANGLDTVVVVATLFDREGPLENIPVRFETTHGKFSSSQTTVVNTNSNGLAIAVLTAPSSRDNIAGTITATIVDNLDAVSGKTADRPEQSAQIKTGKRDYSDVSEQSVDINFRGVRLDLEADPPLIPGDGRSNSEISVRVKDADGTAIPYASITFSARLGSIPVTSTTDQSGVAQARLTSSADPGEIDMVTARYGPLLSDSVEVEYAPAVSRIDLEAEPGSILANGISTTLINAKVIGGTGDPAAGIELGFYTDAGSIEPEVAVTNESGIAEIILTSPSSIEDVEITIRAEVQDIQQLVSVSSSGSFRPGEQFVPLPALPPIKGGLNNSENKLLKAPAKRDRKARDLRETRPMFQLMAEDTTVWDTLKVVARGVQIRLSSAKDSVIARLTETSQVNAWVYETTSGNPVSGDLVRFSTSLGSIPGSERLGVDGQASVIFNAGDRTGEALVVARYGSVHRDSLKITVLPNIASIDITGFRGSILAGGIDSTSVTAIVKDAMGGPAPNVSVVYENDFDRQLTRLVSDENGLVTFVAVSPVVEVDTVMVLTVSAGEISEQQEIVIRGITRSMWVNPDSISAGSDYPVNVTFQAYETLNRRPLTGDTIWFSGIGGLVEPMGVLGGSGMTSIQFSAGDEPGAAWVVANLGALKPDSVAITLLEPTAELSLSSGRRSLLGSGEDTTSIVAEVTNILGDPTPGVWVQFESDHGEMIPLATRTNEDGQAIVIYNAPSGNDDAQTTIRASVNPPALLEWIADNEEPGVNTVLNLPEFERDRGPLRKSADRSIRQTSARNNRSIGDAGILKPFIEPRRDEPVDSLTINVRGVTMELRTNPRTIRADGRSRAGVSVRLSETTSGRAIPNARINFGATRGAIQASGMTGADGTLTDSLTAGIDPGICLIHAVYGNQISGVDSITFSPDPTRMLLSFQLDPGETVADGEGQIDLSSRVTNEAGFPIADVPVAFSLEGYKTVSVDAGIYDQVERWEGTFPVEDTDNVEQIRLSFQARDINSQNMRITVNREVYYEVELPTGPMWHDVVLNLDAIRLAAGVNRVEITGEQFQGAQDEFSIAGMRISLMGSHPIAEAETNEEGNASAVMTADRTEGFVSIKAALVDFPDRSVTRRLIYTAGEPEQLLISVEEDTLVANGVEGTDVLAMVTDAMGNPVSEGFLVNFAAQNGEIEDDAVRTLGDGSASTRFVTPISRQDLEDVISATCEGAEGEWTIILRGPSLRLTAPNDRLLADGESRMTVRARLATPDGGPITGRRINFATTCGAITPAGQTNDEGIAEAVLTVCDFVDTAVVTANFGPHVGDTLEVLYVPLIDRIEMSAQPPSFRADGLDSTFILVDVVNGLGEPAAEVRVNVSTDDGILSLEHVVTDEDGTARTILKGDASTEDDSIHVFATVVGHDVFDTLAVLHRGVTVRITADADSLPANEASSSTITARVAETVSGVPVPSGRVRFETDLGSITGFAQLNEDGEAEARYISSRQTGTATIRAFYGDGLTDDTEITLVDRVYRMEFEIDPGSIIADGVKTAEVLVRLSDLWDGPATRELVTVEYEGGGRVTPEMGLTDQNGIFRAIAIGNALREDDDLIITVQARDGEFSQTDTLGLRGVTMSIEADPELIPGDGEATSLITVRARETGSGNPVASDSIRLASTAGTITGIVILDDAGVALAELRSANQPAIATVTASYGNRLTESTQVAFASQYSYLESVVETESILADGVDSTFITATLRDTLGEPVENAYVHFSLLDDLGRLSGDIAGDSVRTNREGRAIVQYRSAASVTDNSARVRAFIGALSDTVSVRIRGVTLSMTAAPDTIPANGRAVSTITALVRQTTNGNPIAGRLITFGTDAGLIGSSARTGDNGVATVQLIAGEESGEATVNAEFGRTLTAETSVFFAGTIGSVTASAPPEGMLGNGLDSLVVSARVLDGIDGPASGVRVNFRSLNGGTIRQQNIETDNDGNAYTIIYGFAVTEDSLLSVVASANTGEEVISDTAVVKLRGITLAVSVEPDSLPANGTSQAYVTARVLETESGVPVDAGVVSFQTSQGSITGRSNLNDEGIAEVRYTAGEETGTAVIQAHYGNRISSSTNLVLVDRVSVMTMELGRTEILANGVDTTLVSISLTDLWGGAVAYERVIIESEGPGEVSIAEALTNEDGEVKAIAVAEASNADGRLIINIEARDGDFTATDTLDLLGVTVSMSASPRLIAGDGQSTSTITVRVRETTSWNPVINEDVILSSTSGTITGRATLDATGRASVQLRSEDEPAIATVTATYGNELSASTQVAFANRFSYLDTEGDRTVILADGIDSTMVTATVRDTLGDPVSDVYVKFEMLDNFGELAGDSVRTDNYGNASILYRGEALNADQSANLHAFIGSLSDTVRIMLRGVTMTLTASPDTLPADGEATASVTTLLRQTSNGNPLTGRTVYFGSDLGIVGASATTDYSGRATVQLIAPEVTGTANISSEFGRTLFASTEVVFVNSIGSVELSSVENSFLGDGEDDLPISAVVYDAIGNPTSDVLVRFSSPNGGTLSPASGRSDNEGTVSTSLAGFASSIDSVLSVIATVNTQSGDITDTLYIRQRGINLSITVDPDSLPANGTAISTVLARVVETTSGVAIDEGNVRFETDLGSIIGSANLDENGYAQSRFTAGRTAGTADILVRFGSELTSTGQIILVDRVSVMGLDVSPREIIADGVKASEITVSLTDPWGGPAEREQVEISYTGPGMVTPTSGLTDENGEFTALAYGDASTTDGRLILDVEARGGAFAVSDTIELKGVTLSINANPTVIPGDGHSISTISVRVRETTDSSPVVGDTVRLSSTAGAITAFVVLDQAGRASTTLTSDNDPAIATVTASFGDGLTTTADVAFAERYSYLNAFLGRRNILAEGVDTTLVTATLRDTLGDPVSDQYVHFAMLDAIGELSRDSVRTDDNGSASITYTGEAFATDTTSDIRVYIGGLSDTLTVNLKGISLTVSSNPDTLPADGEAISTITALVRQTANGNPISGRMVYFGSDLGVVGAYSTTDYSGRATVQLIAPEQTGTATVSSQFGITLTAATQVVFVNSVSSVELSSDDQSFLGDGLSALELDAFVTDALGEPTSDVLVRFTSPDGGTLSPASGRTDEDGYLSTNLSGFAAVNDSVLSVIATVQSGGGDLTDTLRIRQRGITLEVAVDPDSLPANGDATSIVTASVKETTSGVAINDGRVRFETDLGSIIGSADLDDYGNSSVQFIAGNTPGTADITAYFGNVLSSQAQIILVDRVSTMDLDLSQREILADGVKQSIITISMSDRWGGPAEREQIQISYSGPGTVTPTTGLTDENGEFRAVAVGDASNADGRLILDAEARGGVFTVSDTLELKGVTLTVNADPSIIPGDGESSSTISVRVRETTDWSPVVGDTVRLSSTAGAITGYVILDHAGRASTSLISETDPAIATVTASFGDELNATANVAFAERFSYLDATMGRSNILAEGVDTTMIVATLRDTLGDPVSGQYIHFEMLDAIGALSRDSVRTDDEGIASVTYTGEAFSTDTTADVQVYVGDLSDTLTVNLKGILLTLSANPDSLPANGVSASMITARVRQVSNGNPLAGRNVYFGVSSGTIGASALTDANGQAVVTLTSAETEGDATITAQFGRTLSATTDITYVGTEGSIDLYLDDDSILGDGVDSVLVTAVVLDDIGDPAEDIMVTFSAPDGGRISPSRVETDADGLVETYFYGFASVPDSMLIIEAETPTGVADVANITLRGLTFTLTANPDSLAADGASTSILSARVIETTSGVPVSNRRVRFETDLGSITGSSYLDEDGIATARYTASQNTGTANITARFGNTLTATGEITLVDRVAVIGLEISDYELLSNGQDETDITVSLTDPWGYPAADVSVDILPTGAGSVYPTGGVTDDDGEFHAIATASASTLDSILVIDVEARGGDFTASDTLKIVGVTVSVSANPTLIPGDGSSTSRITARVRETTSWAPITGEELRLSSTAGTIVGRLVLDGSGRVFTDLQSDNESVIATVTAAYGDELTASTNVAFASRYSYLTAETGRSYLLADGVDTTRIEAALLDTLGDPVSDVYVKFALLNSIGEISRDSVRTDDEGIAVISYSGVASTTDTTASIRVYAGSLADTVVANLRGITLTVSADPDSLPANGVSTSVVTARVRQTTNSNPVVGRIVYFGVDDGIIGASGTTDSNGRATVTLTSPEASGDATITAEFGNTLNATTQIAYVDAVGSLELTADNEGVLGNGIDSLYVYARVLDDLGDPAEGVEVTFAAPDGGTFEPASAETDEDGLVETTYFGFAVATDSVVSITADTDMGAADVVNVTIRGVTVSLSLDPDSLSADGESTSIVTARVRETSSGVPVTGELVRFEVDLGSIAGSAYLSNDGLAQVTYTADDVTGTATIQAHYGNRLSTSAQIELVDQASVIELDIDPDAILANGTDNAEIVVRITDPWGDPASDELITLAAVGGGSVSPTTGYTNDEGEFIAQAVAEASGTDSILVITAEAGGGALTVTDTLDLKGVTLTISASPQLIAGDGESTSNITVRVRETTTWNPVIGEPVYLTSTAGVVNGQVTLDASGRAVTTLTSDDQPAIAVVTAMYGDELSASTNVAFASRYSYLDGKLARRNILADGVDTTLFTATLRDTLGMAVSDMWVQFALVTDIGEISLDSAQTGEDGIARAVYAGDASVTDTTVSMRTFIGSLADTVSTTLNGLTLTVTSSPDSIPANGEATSTITARVRQTTNSNPVIGRLVYFSVDNGVIGASSQTNSNGEASVSLIAPETAGDATVTARFGEGLSATTDVVFVDAVSAVDLELSRNNLLGNGLDSLTVTATVTDELGDPTSGVTLVFDAPDGGSVSPANAVTGINGTADVTFFGFASAIDSVLSVEVDAGGGLNDAENITLKGLTLTLNADTDSLTANGTSTSVLTARVVETTSGVPVSGGDVRFETDMGSITGQASIDGVGYARATFTAPVDTGTATIDAVYGDELTASTQIELSDRVTQIALDISPDAVLANGVREADVVVTLTDAWGEPASRELVTLGFTGTGTLSPGMGLTNTDGEFHATAIGLASVTDSILAITAEARGGAFTINDTLDLKGVTLTISASPLRIPGNGESTSTITVRLRETTSGNPVPGDTVRLSSTAGSIEWMVVTDASGRAYADLTSDNTPAIATVTASYGDELTADVDVAFAAEYSYLNASVADDDLLADGVESTTITAVLQDTLGDPVADTWIHFALLDAVGELSVDSSETDDFGRATVDYISGAQAADTTVDLRAYAGTLADTLSIDLRGLTLTVSVDPDSLPANGRSRAQVTARIRQTTSGSGLSGRNIYFGVDDGDIGSIAVTNNSGIATVELVSSETAGDATISAEFGNLHTATTGVTYIATVGTVNLTADADNLLGDGIDSVLVTATVEDALGDPADGITVTFTAPDGGSFEPEEAVTDANGQANAYYYGIAVSADSVVSIEVETETAAVDNANLTLRGVSTSILASPSRIPANGVSTAQVRFSAFETTSNNPLEGQRVTFSTDRGSITRSDILREGVASVMFTAPSDSGDATIVASFGKTIRDTLTLDCFGSVPSHATLAVSPNAISVGGVGRDDSAVLTATILDAERYEVPDGYEVVLRISPDIGVRFANGQDTLALDTENGTVQAVVNAGNDVGQVSFSVEYDGSVLATGANLTVVSGPPSRLTLRPDLSTIENPGSGLTSFPISATLSDAFSNPVEDSTAIRFTLSPDTLAQIDAVGYTQNGILTYDDYPEGVWLTFSDEYAGEELFIIGSAGGGAAVDTARVILPGAIVGGDPDRIEIAIDDDALVADGNSTTTVTVRVFDADDQPVSDLTEVILDANLGVIQSPRYTADGEVTAQYRSGRTAGRDVIVVNVDAISDSVYIELLPGNPADITLTLADDEVRADGVTVTEVYADVVDRFGNTVISGTVINFATELGTIQPTALTDTTGRATARLTAGSETGISLISASWGNVTAQTSVRFISGLADDIVLQSVNREAISVRGSGAPETATLIFEVLDDRGVPLDELNPTEVVFHLDGPAIVIDPAESSEDSVAYLEPDTTTTDELGRAIVTLNSGFFAGAVEITATIGDSIAGEAISIAIHGGPPDVDHFTLAAEKCVLTGIYGTVIDTTMLTAHVGDRFSNPTVPGTIVRFLSTGGVVLGSARTDSAGLCDTWLTTSRPWPVDGIDTVIAQTVDWNDNEITTQSIVLVTGPTRVSYTPAGSYSIPFGSYQDFTVTVADTFGHPLTAGTTVSIEVDAQDENGDDVEGIILTGDATEEAYELQECGQRMNFYVRLFNYAAGLNGADLELIVTVTSRNGDVISRTSGQALGQVISPDFSRVILSPAEVVADGEEECAINITVYDTLGVAVPDVPPDMVSITVDAGDPVITPPDAASDEDGRMSATVVGNSLGTATVRVEIGGDLVTEQPTLNFVPGPPANLTVQVLDRQLVVGGDTSTVIVNVTDANGNAVSDGTMVVFEADDGAFVPNTTNTSAGQAVSLFYSGIEAGDAGFTVTAAYRGSEASEEIDNLVFLPGDPFTIRLTSEEYQVQVGTTHDVTLTATDEYGNTVAENTQFTIAIDPVGQGSVAPNTIRVDAEGQAIVEFTAGTVAGNTARVTASTADTSGQSPLFIFTPGAPRAISMVATTTDTLVNSDVGLAVQVIDAYGNDVSDSTIVTFSSNPEIGAFNPSATNTVNGVANTTLIGVTAAGNLEVVATAGEVSTSEVIRFNEGDPASITVLAEPSAVMVDRSSTISITVVDEYDNPVSGIDLDLSLSALPAGCTIQDATLTTGANGTASTIFTAGGNTGSSIITVEWNADPTVFGRVFVDIDTP